jgi:hypothetical protein
VLTRGKSRVREEAALRQRARAERDSLPRREGGLGGAPERPQQKGNKLGAKRDSFPRSEEGVWGMRRSIPQRKDAHVAQSAERVLGKDEVISSILIVGSNLI